MTYRNKLVKKVRKWDKITKKYNSHNSQNNNNGGFINGIHKSDAIKKLIEKNFIGINELKRMMMSDEEERNGGFGFLNPTIVMDMRHSMVCMFFYY